MSWEKDWEKTGKILERSRKRLGKTTVRGHKRRLKSGKTTDVKTHSRSLPGRKIKNKQPKFKILTSVK